jgi:hypothetical protein
MNQAYDLLAEQIGALPQPVVFMGFAETAIALGYGVYRSWVQRHGEAVFVQSTRYVFNRPVLTKFQEPHSHAPNHLIYAPEEQSLQAVLKEAKTIVLVDDECTTGKTLKHAANSLKEHMPAVEKVVPVVLTNWGVGKVVIDGLVSLLSGQYSFHSTLSQEEIHMPKVEGNTVQRDALMRRNDGRFFLSHPIDTSGLFSNVLAQKGEKIAVVGTGEFVTLPFLLVEYLEEQGAESYCVATSRSPIFIGQAIQAKEQFVDRYGDQMPNFIYNLRQEDYDRILVCYESQEGQQDFDVHRLGNLQVEPIFFGLP